MKKRNQYIGMLSVAGASCIASSAFAQSSVTLYGIVDTGLVYASNQASLGSTSGGHSVTKLASGIWAGSRFGQRNFCSGSGAATYRDGVRSGHRDQ